MVIAQVADKWKPKLLLSAKIQQWYAGFTQYHATIQVCCAWKSLNHDGL